MRIVLSISISLCFFLLGSSSNIEFYPPSHGADVSDTIVSIKGKLIDSFRNHCDRYAECICAEYVRINVLERYSHKDLVNDTIGLFIYCLDEGVKLKKDSVYMITATMKFRPRTLLYGGDDSLLHKHFWSITVKPFFSQGGG